MSILILTNIIELSTNTHEQALAGYLHPNVQSEAQAMSYLYL